MHPERLNAADQIAADAPFCIYRTRLTEPYPLHWHDYYELALILGGRGVHTVNGRRHTLQAGTLFLLTPVDFHTLEPQEKDPLGLFNLIFLGQFLDSELRQWLFTGRAYHHLNLPPPLMEQLLPDFERIWKESRGNSAFRSRLMRTSLEKILLELARQTQSGRPLENRGHSAAHNALLYLNHHFRSPLTLREVAGQARMTPTHFSRIFHASTGMQYQKYLADLRLQFAAGLLLASADLPVTDICFASGFRNMAHFGRSFHAKYGVSPGRYRKNHVEGADDVGNQALDQRPSTSAEEREARINRRWPVGVLTKV
jgi:AraC-like DNA-binding protein